MTVTSLPHEKAKTQQFRQDPPIQISRPKNVQSSLEKCRYFPPSEILKLRKAENPVSIYYVFDGLVLKCRHDTVVTANPPDSEFGTNHGYEIECGVYSVHIQVNNDVRPLIGEFIIDDTLNKHNAGTENSVQNSLKDIPGFMHKSMNVISSLKEYITENKQRLIDQQADHEPPDGHAHP
ncbi:unnamed protein product [Rotaria socialis]|uniref:Uncharacterized protein n=1 Tax=Rotaria socialis TaxID=392032 RepID=A0A821E4J6_9BILA|nr:unnamed protein product [Rotaria socialis]